MSWEEATRPLKEDMAVYPGDPPVKRAVLAAGEEGYWISSLQMCLHSGTHLDAPSHVGLEGTAEDIDLARLNGRVQVIRWQGDTKEFQEKRIALLMDGRGLDLHQARKIAETGVQTLIVDGMSVGEDEDEWDVHRLLLGKGIAVIENAALEGMMEGLYEMRCLPLLIPGADAAPVRLQMRRVQEGDDRSQNEEK